VSDEFVVSDPRMVLRMRSIRAGRLFRLWTKSEWFGSVLVLKAGKIKGGVTITQETARRLERAGYVLLPA
jgi:hypothetical protein